MTIYALSSGPGISGVAVIRVSGKDAARVVKLVTKSDAYIREIACYPGQEQHLYDLIKRHESDGSSIFDEGTTVVECDMQNRRMVSILRDLGYERRDNLITSFADMYGYWFKGEHTGELAKSQEISLQRLDLDVQDTDPLMEQIFALQEDFANHYSNYNKGNSWSGIVVRGYGGKEDFIIKPAEMNQKWRKENSEKLEWKVEDTPLRERLTELKSMLDEGLISQEQYDDKSSRILDEF